MPRPIKELTPNQLDQMNPVSMDIRKWKPGLPPGKYYEGMFDDFEVYFSPGGMKWHRRKYTAPSHPGKE